MKSLLLSLLFLAGAVGAAQAAAPRAAAAPSTNVLIIVSEAPGIYTPTNVVWRKQVRAGDGELYLECELLTAFFGTNSVRTNVAARTPRADGAGGDSNFDRVLAETNVMIILKGIQVLGDRAEYHATNETLVVTGTPAIAEVETGFMVCDWIHHDLRTGATRFGDANAFYGAGTITRRTNAPAPPK